MKKKVWVAVIAVLIVVVLGAFICFVYFTGYDYSMADDDTVAVSDYTVAAGADGSGSLTVKEYNNDKKGVSGVQLNAEAGDESFFMWQIDGDYEIIAGNINNEVIRIAPKSDLKVLALYNDGINAGPANFKIVFGSLNEGFVQTLKLFLITLLGAIPLGLIISFGSMSKFKPISAPVRVIVWIVRGSPLMLQLLIIFYMPGMLFGNNIWGGDETGRFWASAVAFILNYACYFSEIFRGGIQGVPIGQHEAGQVLGLSKSQIFFKVTLMQMIKRIVPPMSNEIITLVKDTSLARIIAMQEIIWAGQAFMKSSHGIHGIIWPLFSTGIYYLAFSGMLTLLFGWVEKKLDYFKV